MEEVSTMLLVSGFVRTESSWKELELQSTSKGGSSYEATTLNNYVTNLPVFQNVTTCT